MSASSPPREPCPKSGSNRSCGGYGRIDVNDPNPALAQGQRRMLLYVRRIYRSREAVLTDNRVERRLVAILAADVAGYNRLMGADEEGVLARRPPESP